MHRQIGRIGALQDAIDIVGRAANHIDIVDLAEALAALRAEQRADFARDGVVSYAVAFLATETTVLRKSILHLDGERVQRSVIALEVHDGDVHLIAHRAIVAGALAALAVIERAPGCWGELC